MAIEFENPTFAGTVLIKEAIQSQNFVTGNDGWQLKANGDAELNGVIIRGDLESLNYVAGVSGWKLNQNGDAEFNSVEIRGDGTGDTILIGGPTEPQVALGSTADVGFIRFPSNRAIETGEAVILAGSFNTGLANEYLTLQIKGPTVSGSLGKTRISINSDSADGTIAPGILMTANTEAPRLASAPIDGNSSALYVNSSGTHTGNLLRLDNNVSPVVTVNNSGDVEFAGEITMAGVDIGKGVQSSVQITVDITGITTTEVVLMTIPSMTFKAGRAYKLTLAGLHQSTTAGTYFLYRLRKGSATTVGTIYIDQMRVPTLPIANTNGVVNMSYYLENNTGADITTALTWTGSAASGTGQFNTPSTNRAFAVVEDIGIAGSWPGMPVT